MCNYQVWFHDEHSGYVVECKHCKKMQLCFGNMLIDMDRRDFNNFYEYISGVQKEKQLIIDRRKKSVVLVTPCTAISFILTINELDGLCRMIDYVDTEIKTSALMDMFDTPA